MKYGHFDDENREYVITDPKTPYPWINYLGNEDFFSLTSNTGGGYTFYKDAKFRRLTRYRYNNVPADDGGKYFYIKDGDTVWSPGWKPVKTPLDSYECRHGMSYTQIKGVKNEVEAEVLQFIPLGFWGELQKVRLTNKGTTKKSLKLFSFIEWCLWNAEDDMTNFQRNFSTGEVEIKDSVIYHKTEFKERRNHYAFYSAKADAGEPLAGRAIKEVVTVNGARVILDNGSWGLVRASSNTPNLVVVCESSDSEEEMRAIFADIDAVIRTEPLVGDYDQTI